MDFYLCYVQWSRMLKRNWTTCRTPNQEQVKQVSIEIDRDQHKIWKHIKNQNWLNFDFSHWIEHLISFQKNKMSLKSIEFHWNDNCCMNKEEMWLWPETNITKEIGSKPLKPHWLCSLRFGIVMIMSKSFPLDRPKLRCAHEHIAWPYDPADFHDLFFSYISLSFDMIFDRTVECLAMSIFITRVQ